MDFAVVASSVAEESSKSLTWMTTRGALASSSIQVCLDVEGCHGLSFGDPAFKPLLAIIPGNDGSSKESARGLILSYNPPKSDDGHREWVSSMVALEPQDFVS